MGSITSTDISNEPQGCYEKSDDSLLFPYSHMLFFLRCSQIVLLLIFFKAQKFS